jgi:prophage regulatory protein
MTTDSEHNRITRIPEIVKQTGLPKSSIYALLKEGKFPKPVQLSRRCIGFVESEIQAWIQSRIDDRDAV